MLKEIIAVMLLLLLFLATLYNVHYLDAVTGELTDMVEKSQQYAGDGDFESAAEELQAAIEKWLGMAGYSHILIRYSEIDSLTDAFYAVYGDLCSGDYESAMGSYGSLYARLDGIAAMEHVRLRNIL